MTFITFDGGDGSGKSTQLKMFADHLRQTAGTDIVFCRDPGSTVLGYAVRNILLNRGTVQIADLTEAFLFSAARTQMIEEVIRPALAEGKTVLCDRYILSTLVYQGFAGGVPIDVLKTLCSIAAGNTLPDIGFVLDVPYEVAVQRLGHRQTLKETPLMDSMESKGEVYHRKVREGFLRLAAEDARYKIIDATGTPDEVSAAVVKQWTE